VRCFPKCGVVRFFEFSNASSLAIDALAVIAFPGSVVSAIISCKIGLYLRECHKIVSKMTLEVTASDQADFPLSRIQIYIMVKCALNAQISTTEARVPMQTHVTLDWI
jgi:hypothetical protein